MTNIFELPFHEYMARRTKYAVDTMQRTNLITVDGSLVALMQAGWAREYWFNKVKGNKHEQTAFNRTGRHDDGTYFPRP